MTTKEGKARVRLEPLVDDTYLEGYHELMTNQAAALWSVSKKPENIEDSREKLHSRMASEERPWCGSWGIMLLDENGDGNGEGKDGNEGRKGKFIGAMGHPLEASIGYRLLPEYWGKGYMTEALRLFLGMWFEMEGNQKYDKVSAGVDPENGASQRVLEKVGFVKGEYIKDACQKTEGGGEWSDIQVFYFFRGGEIK